MDDSIWADGLHDLHCREDRCGPEGEMCSCPCHRGMRFPAVRRQSRRRWIAATLLAVLTLACYAAAEVVADDPVVGLFVLAGQACWIVFVIWLRSWPS